MSDYIEEFEIVKSSPNYFQLEPNSPLRANFEEATAYYKFKLATINWKEFFDWLKTSKSNTQYCKTMLAYAQRYGHMGFDFSLINYEKRRKKNDILKAIANLCRFFDIKFDTVLHETFKTWLKKKEIKWNVKAHSENYAIAKNLSIEQVIERINAIEHRTKHFAKFALVSGLRTNEALEAWNNHEYLCNDGIMELFWDRNTKKANAVYCHPEIHNKIKFKVSTKTIYRNLSREKLGCELRFLRKINYTINATKIDPLLAEFMQGRRGNVSQKHYFLPLMQNNNTKWLDTWNEII